jgi:pimeloyl-ACP methyl ester carboxylesterase
MYIDRHGDGPLAYVGLHGWAGSHRTFRRLKPHVPGGASLYALDLPGVNDTPPPPAWTLDAYTEAIAEGVARIAGPRVIIGYCGGSVAAMHLALRRPDLCQALVLIDPFCYMPLYFKVFTWGTFGRYAYWTTFANPLGRLAANWSLASKRRRDGNLTHAFSRVNHATAVRYMCMLRGFPGTEPYRGLAMPIAMGYGEKTFKAVTAAVAIYRQLWPQSTATELPGAGHEPIKEATDAMAALVFATKPAPASPAERVRA